MALASGLPHRISFGAPAMEGSRLSHLSGDGPSPPPLPLRAFLQVPNMFRGVLRQASSRAAVCRYATKVKDFTGLAGYPVEPKWRGKRGVAYTGGTPPPWCPHPVSQQLFPQPSAPQSTSFNSCPADQRMVGQELIC